MDPIPNLMEAARAGDIDRLYQLITDNPTVLKEIDEKPLVSTPLHVAASAGQTNFALEMMNLAPSFGRKLNPDGLSPLDLALLNNRYDTVKRLANFDGELVRVKGKDRLTPLHRAAGSDDKILYLIELLLACPDSIEDLTIHNENALDIARKSPAAFKILYEWVKRSGDHKQLLQKEGADGKSAETYHKEQQPKILKSLQGVKVEKPSSLEDDAAQSMYHYLRTREGFYESLLRKVLLSMFWSPRDLTMEVRLVVLVVAVIIATASFQAIIGFFDPSGGRFQDANFFFLLNTIAFISSVGAITIVLQLRAYTLILHLSLVSLQACYWATLNQVLSRPLVFTYRIGSAFFVILVYYFKILFWAIKSGKHEWLASVILSPCMKRKFRCLHQMGVF